MTRAHKYQLVSIILMGVCLVLILGWDIAATLLVKHGKATESQVILASAYMNFTLPYLWGIFLFHLFVPLPKAWIWKNKIAKHSILWGSATVLATLNGFLIIPPLYPAIPLACGMLAGALWAQSTDVLKLPYIGKRD